MNDSSIAVRYAKALYESAFESKVSDLVLLDLRYLDTLIQEVPEFSEIIHSPIIQVSDKLKMMTMVVKDQCQELTFRFLEMITRNKREGYLPAMIRKYFQLYRKDQGIVRATLSTVLVNQEDTMSEIKVLLKEKYQAEVELEQAQDPDLIGGFILRVEDKQLDASVASQLKKIRRELEQSVI